MIKLFVIFALLLPLYLTKDISLLMAHCVIDQIEGKWKFSLTDRVKTRADAISECKADTEITPTSYINVDLQLPNIAVDLDTQEKGTWTMIVDTGVEIRVNENRYLAFFKYHQTIFKTTSYCNMTWTGWYHEEEVAAKEYGCLKGEKQANDTNTLKYVHEYENTPMKDSKYPVNRQFQNFRVNDELKHMEKMKKFRPKLDVSDLPETFDWRHVDKHSYVPYIRDQAACGSCYVFSVIGMLDSRRRIVTNLTDLEIKSEQDVLSCGKPTNQGCKGGFPFLVSKFVREYGYVTDGEVHYMAVDGVCKDEKYTKRHNLVDFEYVGGYYGGCSEEAMMLEIYNNGPIAVSFYVEQSFFDYKFGVYSCGKVKPFEANHAVTIVGWGKGYWIVRNSWGESWGMRGYFNMKKGTNSCNIEAAASSIKVTA